MKEKIKLIIWILFSAVALMGSVAALFFWQDTPTIKFDLINNILKFVSSGI